MTSHPEWDRTLDNLAYLCSQDVLSIEEGRQIFESIHGFDPATSKPTPHYKIAVETVHGVDQMFGKHVGGWLRKTWSKVFPG